VKILVPVSLKTWLNDLTLQQALINAITASAGVLPSSVVIDHALPHSQTRNRRLLSRSATTDYTLLSASITSGRPPRDLSTRLALLPFPLRHARARWALIDHIHVMSK